MPQSRFWSSVWVAGKYLLAVGLLQYIVTSLVTLFGLMPGDWFDLLFKVCAIVVPVWGSLVYVNWQWGWKAEHIGLSLRPAALAPLGLGLVGGVVAAYAVHVISVWLQSGALSLAVPGLLGSVSPVNLVVNLGLAFAVEFVFRGTVVSRLYADLDRREATIAAVLVPFLWVLVSMLFGAQMPMTAIGSVWSGAMSVFLTLLFLRIDSVWLPAGVRMGVVAATGLFSFSASDDGRLAVWGAAAAVLAILEFLRQQGAPKRVNPDRRVYRGGRTVRGPWGPH